MSEDGFIKCPSCNTWLSIYGCSSHIIRCGERKYGTSRSSSSSYTPNILSDITIPKIDIPKIELPKTTPLFDYTSFLTKKEEEKPVSIQPIDLSFLTKKEEKKPSFPSFDYSSFLGDLRKQQEERRKQEEEERRREEEKKRQDDIMHDMYLEATASSYDTRGRFSNDPIEQMSCRMQAGWLRSLKRRP